jgi:hypothetical protein
MMTAYNADVAACREGIRGYPEKFAGTAVTPPDVTLPLPDNPA